MRVLYIEDDPDARAYLEAGLKSQGVTADVAPDGDPHGPPPNALGESRTSGRATARRGGAPPPAHRSGFPKKNGPLHAT